MVVLLGKALLEDPVVALWLLSILTTEVLKRSHLAVARMFTCKLMSK